MAGEAEVRKALEGVLGDPGAVTSVRKASHGKFYEVVVSNGDVLYVEENGAYLFAGQLIDLKTRKNITAARQQELSRINFADLPLDQAIKQVRGNGKRVIATFEDPNCVYCKKLAKEMQTLKDATIYTFLIPILSPDSEVKAKNIWCAGDRAKAWNDWMVDGKQPASANCDSPIARNADLAHKYRINGTPTLFMADGSRIGGYVALSELESSMNQAAEAKPAKK
jgi:thiol:disulfide interchange protein DsbC